MAGSVFGKCFTITTWGESHGPGLGVVIDGCPAGLALSEEDIQETEKYIADLESIYRRFMNMSHFVWNA